MEQCVRVFLKLAGGEFGSPEEVAAVLRLEECLRATIQERGAGQYDGNEFGGGECSLFMYGPDADRLFQAIRPILAAAPVARGGHTIKRYGQPGEGKEVRVKL